MEAIASAYEPCWHCGNPINAPLVCDRCHTPQPLPAGLDSYRVLGLARSLALDRTDLERRYHAASLAVHPDRHQGGATRAEQLSLAASATVNRAYRTLRDPLARGKYWLELHGVCLNADNRVPPSLAALVFDTQEQLEELRAAPDDAVTRAAVETARTSLEQRVAELLAGLDAMFTAWPTSSAEEPAALAALQQHLAEIKYLRTLLGDVEDTLGEPRGTDRRH